MEHANTVSIIIHYLFCLLIMCTKSVIFSRDKMESCEEQSKTASLIIITVIVNNNKPFRSKRGTNLMTSV